jgi:hypothetical protein
LDFPSDTDELHQARELISQLSKEVEGLRRLNATYQIQFENRVQENTWSLQVEIGNLREELKEARSELNRKERFRQEVVSELHSLQEKINKAVDARPNWLRETFTVDPALGFVLMPYKPHWFASVLEAIEKVLDNRGLKCRTARQMHGSVIMADVWKGVSSARVLFADITGNNPNVSYEIGLAEILGKPVALLCQEAHANDIAFDLRGRRLLLYDPGDLDKLSAELKAWLNDTL